MATSPSKHTVSTSKNSKIKNEKNKTETKKKKKKKQKTSRSESDHPQEQHLTSSAPIKHVKSPCVRLIGGRIYDSENGRTCHQCRQKTLDFVASCKNQTEQCTICYCHKCLLNRYGEKAEEVAVLGNWKCPKCRGVCNCSVCMKKRGCQPTGVLVFSAKANGFSSVSDMLYVKDSEKGKTDEGISSKKRGASKELKNTMGVQGKDSVHKIPLPQGIELTNLASINMPAEDIGQALQLLEFCEAFAQVLDLKEGQPEVLLRGLACDQSSHHKYDPLIFQLHVKLLSMLQINSGKEYSYMKTRGRKFWLEALRKFVFKSQCPSKEFLLDYFDVHPDGYEELNSSMKLRLLNFLCDEALGTLELRNWIDEQNSEYVEEEKKAQEKDKNTKKQLQDEVARATLMKNGAPLSISEHEDFVLKIKAEAAQTLVETLDATETVKKKKQRSDAVRSEPIFSDTYGRKFWKLRGYHGRMEILLQDVGNGFEERWFTYDVQEKAVIEKYMSSERCTG